MSKPDPSGASKYCWYCPTCDVGDPWDRNATYQWAMRRCREHNEARHPGQLTGHMLAPTPDAPTGRDEP